MREESVLGIRSDRFCSSSLILLFQCEGTRYLALARQLTNQVEGAATKWRKKTMMNSSALNLEPESRKSPRSCFLQGHYSICIIILLQFTKARARTRPQIWHPDSDSCLLVEQCWLMCGGRSECNHETVSHSPATLSYFVSQRLFRTLSSVPTVLPKHLSARMCRPLGASGGQRIAGRARRAGEDSGGRSDGGAAERGHGERSRLQLLLSSCG